MGVAASSSSSSFKKHEVFLSFRGEDTRRTFTSHLHTALCLTGIETYIDYELPKGDDISQSLIKAIQDSSISVIVFSENYASSKWCLNELIQILRCKQNQGQLVIPIFYHVDPSHVRNQRGAYEEAFEEHLKKNPEKVDQWRHALFETANLAGWDSSNCRDEAEFIQNIVNDVIKKLNHEPSSVLANIIGIYENSDDIIELLLEEITTIGIWGMAGIGKTTMAKFVFAKLCSQFDSFYFLENLREKTEKYGLQYIRDKLFCELLKDASFKGSNRRKVLIVLDDVSKTDQLDHLKSEAPPLRHGSKVIITSRDKHVLDGRVDKIHKAKELSYDNSVKLFNLKAFYKDTYKSEYKELVERAVAYAQGNPLALTILGSFLHSKTIKEWKSALRKIKAMSHQDIHGVLKLSYDGLDDEEKEIFLDIACFFRGTSRGYVIAMLESCGFYASIGLRTLMDKALISIDYNDKVQMHDLIQSMAFEIVRQECIKNPGRRSRLWNPDEIYDVLKNNQGSDAIQGINLDLSQIRDLQLNADAFRKMNNLRFLKFYSPRDKRSCTINLRLGLESLSNLLRYLQWDSFPLQSLPLSFCPEKLVELRMPNSHLKKLWDGVQDLVNLKIISFNGCKQLMELPNFSTAQNLELVDLEGCENLCHLHPSILSLPRLSDMELSYCQNLKSLKTESQSKSLSRLNVVGCSSLKEFSFSSDKITYLNLEQTGIETLDFSIGHMEKLQELNLNGSTLKNLPVNEICFMRSLERLRLYDCGGIIDQSKLHTLFDALLSLKLISLSGASKLTELPNNTKHLSRLQSLYISNCKDLQSLPKLPPSIKELHVRKCTSLKTLQLITSHVESSLLVDERMLGSTLCSSTGHLINLRRLTLCGRSQLRGLPEVIHSLSSLSSLDLSGSNVKSLPDSIKLLSNLEYICLNNCRKLNSLPELPPFIEIVHASCCISLEIVPVSITSTPQLRYLFLKDCLKLENHSLSHAMRHAYFSLKRSVYTKRRGRVCYPGRTVPEWFRFGQVTKASNSITIELPSAVSNLIGFIFCSVLSWCPHSRLQCQLYFDGKQRQCSEFGKINSGSQHAFLWCDSNTFINFHKTKDDQFTNYRPKVSFEFSIVRCGGEKFVDNVIEECGVYPIYASEYHNFIQEMELESKFGIMKETCHDVDENTFHGILKYATISQGKCGNFKGSVIPKWFPCRSSTISEHGGLQVSVKHAPDFDNLKGFIFCFVIPHFSSKEWDQCHSSCNCYLYDRHWRYCFHLKGPIGWHHSMVKLNSDYMFLWYDPLYCESILRKLKRRRGKCNHDMLDFGFKFGNGLIKECGVRPISIPQYKNFLKKRKRVKARMPIKKRHRNIDEDQHQLPPTKKLKELSIVHLASHDMDELLLMMSRLNLESAN